MSLALPEAVLVAEDDPIFRHILESWLKQWKYPVVSVDNGTDAWKEMQRENPPKLAILDWMMPGMDGIELCHKIRSRNESPYTYVLLLTAKDNKQDIVNGFEAGADDYLTKPFNVHELRARVQAGKRILELQDALLCAHHALQFEAAHDPLTSVLNRGAILDVLVREIERRARTKDSLGVIMLDLDFFKKVNDAHGHLIGDAVLKEAARRLLLAIRSYDSVGRYGGEEFLAVIPGCDLSNLIVSAERLRQCMADRPIETNIGPINVTLSIGLASVTGGEPSDAESLIRVADEALYKAKIAGRNRVEMARTSIAAKAAAHLD
jgi:two-component system cell cycle response regulator